MSWMRRLWNTLRPGRMESAIERELAFHLAERVDHLRAEGLSHEEASRRARRQFGNVTLQAERTRDMDVSLWIDAFLRDLRYAASSLARTPGFTIAVVLTLALGIGANSAVFSAVEAVLLRPLSFPDSDRLMRLSQIQERTAETNIAPVRLEDWNRLNDTFAALTGHYVEDVSDTSGEMPERIRRAFVAPRFLEVWGVQPARGRGFTAAEHTEAGPDAVLISERYWRVRMGGTPDVLNQAVRLGLSSFPIIGVMPASFRFPDRDVDVWFPITLDNKYAQSRRNTWYRGIGRLKPGVSAEQARANLAAVQAQLAEQYPDTDRNLRIEVVPLKETTVSDIRRSLWLVFGGVSVLLLITCTNIAGLLLSRATHRREEISIRLSLGASRARVAMQLLTETFLLAVAGAGVGLAGAVGTAAALRWAAGDLPRMDEIRIDWIVVLYTFGTAMIVTVLCGVLPAIRVGRDTVATALKDSARTQVAGGHSVQWLLVGAQVALSVVLLSAAALLGRSFHELSRVEMGFDATRVLTFRVSGTFAETVNYDRLLARIDDTIDALRALPGVEGAATSTFLPGVPAEFERAFAVTEGQNDAERLVAEHRIVSPEYFATMKIPLLAGEVCRRQPVNATRLLLVNQTFVTRYLSGRPSAIGLHLSAGATWSPDRIVGVVSDARDAGIDRPPGPMVYSCFSAPNPTPVFLVRTRGEPLDLAQTVRLKMKEREPLRSVYNIASLEDRIGDAFAQNRLRTIVLAIFALSALSLACVGLYGTLNYVVSLRRREVGLRLALGAARIGIIRQFLTHGLRVISVACGCGLALAVAFTRAMRGMLYGVSATDPLVLSTVILLVLAVATVAAVVPAARASLIEPMRVLREG